MGGVGVGFVGILDLGFRCLFWGFCWFGFCGLVSLVCFVGLGFW